MSTPKNHHFVSRVLSDKFLNADGKIFVYNKEKDFFESKKSTKSLFSEEYLNSTITKEGEIDHSSIEQNLNQNFETDFNRHYNRVISILNTGGDSNELAESIEYLIGMGAIGHMRNPRHMKESYEEVASVWRMLAGMATDELRESIEGFEKHVSPVKNKVPLNPKQMKDKSFELMGDMIFGIFMSPEDDYFILPDCTSALIRSKLDDDVVLDGQVLETLARPVSTVIYPINSKIVIVAQSAKICPQDSHGIYPLTKETMYKYNKMFYNESYEKVACENEEYLKGFVKQYKSELELVG